MLYSSHTYLFHTLIPFVGNTRLSLIHTTFLSGLPLLFVISQCFPCNISTHYAITIFVAATLSFQLSIYSFFCLLRVHSFNKLLLVVDTIAATLVVSADCCYIWFSGHPHIQLVLCFTMYYIHVHILCFCV